jgi:hypothetical protein
MKYADINLMDQAYLHDIICPLFVGDDSTWKMLKNILDPSVRIRSGTIPCMIQENRHGKISR